MVHPILVPDTQAMTRITDTLWSTLSPSQRRTLGLGRMEPTYARVLGAMGWRRARHASATSR